MALVLAQLTGVRTFCLRMVNTADALESGLGSSIRPDDVVSYSKVEFIPHGLAYNLPKVFTFDRVHTMLTAEPDKQFKNLTDG